VARIQYFQAPNGRVHQVKDGFCWAAFCFGPLWAAAKNVWFVFWVLCFTHLFLYGIDEQMPHGFVQDIAIILLWIVHMMICGKFGNQWLRWNYLRKNYQLL
jgi:hypothetical protein